MSKIWKGLFDTHAGATLKVLGIDPGSRVCGYGLVSKGKGAKVNLIDYGEIKTTRGALLSHRIKEVYEGLSAVIEAGKPDAVVIESLFHGKNIKSTIVLSHLRGVAVLCAAQAGIDLYEYSPAVIKQAVVGSGRADKGQVQFMIRLLLNNDSITGADAADALAVAICHINHLGPLGATNVV